MSTAREKGRELERRIAAFLQTRDYEVSTNVFREGKSGARHELDVVATKNDGLATFMMVVECKAWESPVDKDIVYKLAGELSDLGAAKGVIATLSGWTLQAGQVAAQNNIDIWGPDELTTMMGHLSMNDLHQGSAPLIAMGVTFTVPSQTAFTRIGRLTKGTLGMGREEVTWYGPLWLPTWSLQLGITRGEGFMKRTPRITQVWNGYEALTSTCAYQLNAKPDFAEVDLSEGHIEPAQKAADVEKFLKSSISKWRQVTSKEAKSRHAATLARLGVQVPFSSVVFEATELIYLPLWVALLSKRGQERVVAIDGVTGQERERIGVAMTKNAQRVRNAAHI
jgi:hypothetical protein